MSARRRAWLGALLALAVVAAVALVALGGFATAAPGVPLHEVARSDFVRRVQAEGNLEAVDATVLGPPPEVTWPLKIAWLAPDGSPVKAGEVVIRFDATELEQERQKGAFDRAVLGSKIDGRSVREEGTLRNLERDRELAEVELDHARALATKDEQIFSRNEIVEAEIDETLASRKMDHATATGQIQRELGRTEIELLTIERRMAEIKVEQADKALRGLEVRAPHDGIFVLKRIWGRVPEVGRVVWGGNAVAELPKLEAMQARVFVLEADAGGLAAGVAAELVLDAYPGVVYGAVVKSADTLAERRSRQSPVQYFGVTLALDRTDPLMKPGQRVRATLILDEHKGVLTVPPQAVFEEGDARVVHVWRGSAFEPRPVVLGPAGLGRVVIESGLAEGDRVALANPKAPGGPAPEERTASRGPLAP